MSENLLPLVSTVVELAVFFAGLFWAMRRFQVERLAIEAEANSDNAITSKTMAQAGEEWMDSYNRLWKLFRERDVEFLDLNNRVLALESDKRVLQEELEAERRLRKQLQQDLADERRLRQQLQAELDAERRQRKVTELPSPN